MTRHVETMPRNYSRAFYGVPADFWLNTNDKIVAVFGLRASINRDDTIVVPMGSAEVANSVESKPNHLGWTFEAQGKSLLYKIRFVGRWSSMSIGRRPTSRQTLTMEKQRN